MASGKTLYMAQAIASYVFGKTLWTPPDSYFVGLSSAAFVNTATGTSFNELAGSGYARVEIVNDMTSWSVVDTDGMVANVIRLNFPVPTADWAPALSYYILDAATDGNALFGDDFATPANVVTGTAPYFDIGDINITELILN